MKIVEGDLIEMAKHGYFDVIVHGCNCFNTMGGGIARTVRDNFPDAYRADQRTKKGDINKLGTCSVGKYNDGDRISLFIINAYTQFKYWKDNSDDPKTPLVDYEALRACFEDVKEHLGGRGLRFGIPKIGAGLALGNWDIISGIIDEVMAGENLTLVIKE